jgi:methylated-DNA-protein-cysteine methyltransferase-like protein
VDREFESAVRRVILAIPRGEFSTYGAVAEAAGYPRRHRAVAQLLARDSSGLPWQRVLGAGGEIKLPGARGAEQRLLLQMEGVVFRGRRAMPGNLGD